MVDLPVIIMCESFEDFAEIVQFCRENGKPHWFGDETDDSMMKFYESAKNRRYGNITCIDIERLGKDHKSGYAGIHWYEEEPEYRHHTWTQSSDFLQAIGRASPQVDVDVTDFL